MEFIIGHGHGLSIDKNTNDDRGYVLLDEKNHRRAKFRISDIVRKPKLIR